jgi:thioredoxin-like negative regulator of GroEL
MIELLLAAERILATGDLDHAERLFAQVAAADPQNAIAVVGLAEVAAARGDEAGTLEAARRALEIDPDNAAARRMIDRLEAVARQSDATSAPELGAAPEAPPVPTRPSWLDRLLRFLRRR